MTGLNEALRMLELFKSVGADSFVVTKTDILQEVKWGMTYSTSDLRRHLPAMVRTAAIRRPSKISDSETVRAGENLIIRPTGKTWHFSSLTTWPQLSSNACARRRSSFMPPVPAAIRHG